MVVGSVSLAPPLPSLIVFDLDFTLWQRPRFRKGPPFEPIDGGAAGVRDAGGATLYLYPAAKRALVCLADAGVPVAVASRTHREGWARQWLEMLTVDDAGRTVQDVIDPLPVLVQDGPKSGHLQRISEMSGVPLSKMLFFDDDLADVARAEQMGVTSVHVPAADRRLGSCGLTDELFEEGLQRHTEYITLGYRIGHDAWTRARDARTAARAKRDQLRLRYGGWKR